MSSAPLKVTPQKNLGQNFLTDTHYQQRICAAIAPDAATPILEIGAGTGALTTPLLAAGAHVVVVEKDTRCQPVLAALAAQFPGQLEVLEADVLKTDLTKLVPKGSKVVGNLPYNIGTKIVTDCLATGHFRKMVFLLQKEVVQRICAAPGSHDWGRLAIYAQMQADCSHLFDVPPGAFHPAPAVMSALVGLVPLPELRYPCDMRRLENITRQAFGQRRKMLRASLKGLLTIDQIEAAGIPSDTRPETLTLEMFSRLAQS